VKSVKSAVLISVFGFNLNKREKSIGREKAQKAQKIFNHKERRDRKAGQAIELHATASTLTSRSRRLPSRVCVTRVDAACHGQC
jgi:hypothetical protein